MKYSIVLPVRNGMDYVKDCVSSILSQEFQDFNLIVLDNNSEDGTPEWIGSLKDHRIIIIKSDKSLTIEENWGRIASVSKNEFMTIIGHDDLLDKNYLTIMDELVSKHPGAALYQAHFRYIDGQGREIKKSLPMKEVLQPREVVHNFLCGKMDIMGTGFMMRSRDFDEGGGMPAYPNLLFADMELWIEMSRKGYLAVAKEECFSYRKHGGATTSTSTDLKVLHAFDQFVNYLEKLEKTDPTLTKTIKEDSGELLAEYCQGITHKTLRTPYRLRQTPSVSEIIDQFRQYGKRLRGDLGFEPLDSKLIRAGKTIDSNWLTRSLFLLFKKIRRKPVL